MAKPHGFQLGLVDSTVRIMLLALQAASDHGAGVDEILLIKARIDHAIDTQLLFAHIINITPPDDSDGEKH